MITTEKLRYIVFQIFFNLNVNGPFIGNIFFYRTNTMITVCMVFSILYNFSRFFEYTYKEEDVMDEVRNILNKICSRNARTSNLMLKFSGNDSYVEDHHRVITRLVTTSVRQNYYYITFYIIWVYLFVMYFIPFSVLLSLNWKIWTEIKQAKIRYRKFLAIHTKGWSLYANLKFD